MSRLGPVLWIALLLAGCGPATTGSYRGFPVGIENAPPAPIVTFQDEPPYRLLPGTQVYVVEPAASDDDLFMVDSQWYLYHQGYWYRASGWKGPYAVADVRSVPAPILEVPPELWKHHP